MADDEMQEIRGKKEPRPPVGTNVEEGERVPQEGSAGETKPVQMPAQEPAPQESEEERPEQGLEADDFSDLPGRDVSETKPAEEEPLPAPPKPPAQEAEKAGGEAAPEEIKPPAEERKAEEPPQEIQSPAGEPREPAEKEEALHEVKPPEDLKALHESEQDAQELLEGDESKPRYMRFHERARQSFPGSAEQAKKDMTPVSSEPQVTTEQRVNQAIELHKAQQKEGFFSKLLGPVKRKLGFK